MKQVKGEKRKVNVAKILMVACAVFAFVVGVCDILAMKSYENTWNYTDHCAISVEGEESIYGDTGEVNLCKDMAMYYYEGQYEAKLTQAMVAFATGTILMFLAFGRKQ